VRYSHSLLDENDELKSRSSLLGACKSFSGLQSELAGKVAMISCLRRLVQIALLLSVTTTLAPFTAAS
jgi:hypothetical protein